MKTKKLKTIITLLSSIFILLLASCKGNANGELSVAIYKVNTFSGNGLEKAINEIYKDSSQKINIIHVDDEVELSNLIKSKKVQLIFTTAGNNQRICTEKANKKSAIAAIDTSNITSSVRQGLITKDNEIAAVPVLTDNYEIDINLYDFRNSDVEAINNWNDVERFLLTQKKNNNIPLYFAGADSISFFDMLGAFCEALDGQQYYKKALEILDNGGNPQQIAVDLLGTPSSPMVNTATLLKGYFRKGFISPDSFNLNTKDLEKYAEADYAKMMLMSLSDHRKINYNVIRRFSSAYMPSTQGAALRTFTANILYAIPVNKNAMNSVFVNDLLSDDNQTILSRNTGLAPVTRNCRTPDKQADDARYWIAATNTPFAGLGHDTKLSEEDLNQVKANIKNILLYE